MGPAWIAAAATLAGAAAAWWAAINGSRTLAAAREGSRQRSRPKMAAELRRQPHHERHQFLIVANYGPGVARNVRVTFDPPVPDADTAPDGQRSVLATVARRYTRPIASFTPGMEFANIWLTSIPGDDNKMVAAEPVADETVVRFQYEDDAGTSYSDQYVLDTRLLVGETWVTSSNEPHELAKKQTKALEGIAKAAASLGR